ncbi:MAG: class I SAM-dependent methyltransferase [Bacteroidia bacterium]|nr:class I SAM-dependent methyltransferase [Bacteroidia bacterium]
MIFDLFQQKKYPSDLQFDAIYPRKYQEHSARHFTPVSIAVKAAKLLADKPENRILDIGSGVGKVCCIGASVTGAHFYGVEKRKTLTNLSNKIKREYKLKNAHFINADFTTLDFSRFNGIYFFNSFHEHVDETCVLDDTSRVSLKAYKTYHESLKDKLNECVKGTRLVTYYTFKNKIPSSFQFIDANETGLLKFYIKK